MKNGQCSTNHILEFYLVSSVNDSTRIIATLTDTTYQVEIGIIGETWVTAVYSNPDGTSGPSNVVISSDLPISVESINRNDEIRIIYDNNSEMIKINNAKSISYIYLFDINGRMIKSVTHLVNEISLSDLPTGMYIIEIRAGNDIIRKKIIK